MLTSHARQLAMLIYSCWLQLRLLSLHTAISTALAAQTLLTVAAMALVGPTAAVELTGSVGRMMHHVPIGRDPRSRTLVVAYLRYSTPYQKQFSGDRQLESIMRYAELAGLVIIKVFRDYGVSGTLRHRQGLDDALAFLTAGHAHGLVVEDCDRLARKCSIIPELYEDLKEKGLTLWERKHGAIDTATKAGLFGGIATDARENLLDRTSYGKHRSFEEGNFPVAPWGFSRGEDGKWQVDPVIGPIVTQVFLDAYNGVPLGTIAKDLQTRSVLKSEGGPITESFLWQQIVKPAHKGYWIWGAAKPGVRQRHAPTLVISEDLRTTTPEIWDELDRRREERRAKRPADSKAVGEDADAGQVERLSKIALHRRVHCISCELVMGASISVRGGYRKERDFSCYHPAVDQARPYTAGHHLHAFEIETEIVAALRRKFGSDGFEALFDAEAEAAHGEALREAEADRALANASYLATEAEIEVSFDPNWHRGYSETRKIKRRGKLDERSVEFKAAVERADMRIAQLQANHAGSIALGEALTDLLNHGGLPEEDSIERRRLIAALRRIVHKVRIDFQHDGTILLHIDFAPHGDGGADAPVRIETVIRTLFRASMLTQSHPMFADLRAAVERGRYGLSAEDRAEMLRDVPALGELPSRWDRTVRVEFMRALLMSADIGLPIVGGSVVFGRCKRNWAYARLLFRRAGGIDQFRRFIERRADLLVEADVRTALTRFARSSHIMRLLTAD